MKGWIALLLALGVAAVCIRLGFWQLDRLEQRRAFNAEVAAAMAAPPLVLDHPSLDSIHRDPDAFLYRRAVADGEFVHRAEVLLRGRSDQGRPGVHLLVPLALSDGSGHILVNRGWIPSPDAATADPRPHRRPGRQRVEGILYATPPGDAETSPLAIDLPDTTLTSLRRIDREYLASALGHPLPALYLEALPAAAASSELPRPVAAPTLDEGPHLGYAVQWFSFAAIAILGLAVVAGARLRGRPHRPSEGV